MSTKSIWFWKKKLMLDLLAILLEAKENLQNFMSIYQEQQERKNIICKNFALRKAFYTHQEYLYKMFFQ